MNAIIMDDQGRRSRDLAAMILLSLFGSIAAWWLIFEFTAWVFLT